LNYNELLQRILKFEDNLSRTVLRSPVNGVVKTLYVVTIGGVLKPGFTVVDIVPGGDRLIIEAKLPTQDIGYVRRGQQALVMLASADAMRFGNLTGKVVRVSPDTLVTNEGMPFYKVRIETEQDHFQRGKLKYQLFPGMQVMTNIQTGQRTVLEYIFDPFLRSFNDAMLER
jgi:adhesin transport system membrane fusion protein